MNVDEQMDVIRDVISPNFPLADWTDEDYGDLRAEILEGECNRICYLMVEDNTPITKQNVIDFVERGKLMHDEDIDKLPNTKMGEWVKGVLLPNNPGLRATAINHQDEFLKRDFDVVMSFLADDYVDGFIEDFTSGVSQEDKRAQVRDAIYQTLKGAVMLVVVSEMTGRDVRNNPGYQRDIKQAMSFRDVQ